MRSAMAFITATREDQALHEALVAVASDGGLDAVAALACSRGFPISATDLRRAFAVDWGLRWARYQAG